jgi:hypothetical protein
MRELGLRHQDSGPDRRGWQLNGGRDHAPGKNKSVVPIDENCDGMISGLRIGPSYCPPSRQLCGDRPSGSPTTLGNFRELCYYHFFKRSGASVGSVWRITCASQNGPRWLRLDLLCL